MKIIVIDDERTFANYALNSNVKQPEYYRTSDAGLLAVAKHTVEYAVRYGEKAELWLDHDLGNGDDIRIVVDFLIVNPTPSISRILIHSQNPVSADLVDVLTHSGYVCDKVGLPKLMIG